MYAVMKNKDITEQYSEVKLEQNECSKWQGYFTLFYP